MTDKNIDLDKLREAFEVHAPSFQINTKRSPLNQDEYKFEFAASMWKFVQAIAASQPSAEPVPTKLRHSEAYVSDLEDSLRQIADALGVNGGTDDLIAKVREVAAAPAAPAVAAEVFTDCRSDVGIAVGLIDGIIAAARALRNYDLAAPAVVEAIKDISQDEDIVALLAAQPAPAPCTVPLNLAPPQD